MSDKHFRLDQPNLAWLNVERDFSRSTGKCHWNKDQSQTSKCFCRFRRATAGQPGGEVLGASRWWKAGWRRLNWATQSFTDKKPGPSWLSSLWLDEMCLTSGRSLVYGMLDLWGWWHWSYRCMIQASLQSQTRIFFMVLFSVLSVGLLTLSLFPFFHSMCFFLPG